MALQLSFMGAAEHEGRGARSWRYLVLLTASIVLFLLLGRFFGLAILNRIRLMVDFFSSATPQACGLYVAIYVVACCAGVPITAFELLTGYLFGWWLGMCLDIIGRMVASAACFLVARSMMRFGFGPGLDSALIQGIGSAVQHQGLRFLVLFNLLYIPVAVKNYGLGFVPEITLWRFLVAIFVVEVPVASAWAFIGSSARASGVHFDDLNAAHGHGWLASLATLLAIVAFVLVLRIVHERVNAAIEHGGVLGGTVLSASARVATVSRRSPPDGSEAV